MQIDNLSPWGAQLAPAWGKNGKMQMTLVVKTGFHWDNEGTLTPIPQEEIELETAERFHNDDAINASLAAANDIVPFKQGFEILFQGTAYPPTQEATIMRLSAALCKTNAPDTEYWKKELLVIGKRHWKKSFVGLMQASPEPLTPTPVQYEYAYGGRKLDDEGNEKETNGRCEQNPVGIGYVADGHGWNLPQIEQQPLITKAKQKAKPAGFAAIAHVWPPRWQHFKNMDTAAAEKGRCPYPANVEPSLYNAAPEDQQFKTAPAPNDHLVLVGWHKSKDQQQLALPEATPKVMAYEDKKWTELLLTCDTLIVDANNQAIYQLWRAGIEFDPGNMPATRFQLTDPWHEQWLASEQDKQHTEEATKDDR